MSWPLASFLIVALVLAVGLARLRAQAPVGAHGRGRRRARRPRGARARRVRRAARRQADHRDDVRRAATRSARSRASPSARSGCSSPTSCSARAPTRPGRWPPGGWSGLAGAVARPRSRAGASGAFSSRSRCGCERARREGGDERLHVDARGEPHAGRVPARRRAGARLRPHRHGRELPLRARLRAGARPRARRGRACAWRSCGSRSRRRPEPSGAAARRPRGRAAASSACSARGGRWP